MKITVNGKEENIEVKTISDFISSKGLDRKAIIVEYNMKIAKKATWNKVELKEGDSLEILNIVGGG